MAEVAEKITSPFIDYKKGVELKHGDLWYGQQLPNYDMRPIYQHFVKGRNSALKNNLEYDQLFGLESKKIFPDGQILPVLYQVMPAPDRMILEDYLYPVAIWNITLATLDGVSNKPLFIQRPLLDKNNNPVVFTGQAIRMVTTQLSAFYYVIINTNYVPQPLNDGTDNTDDGLKWTYGEPVIGRYIKEQLVAEERYGLNKLDYPQR